MSKRYLFPLLAVCGLLLTGCFPQFEQPVSDPALAQQDLDLHGLWVHQQSEAGLQYLHIGGESEKPLDANREEPELGLMRLIYSSYDAKSRKLGGPLTFRFFASHVGDVAIANLVLPFEGSTETGPTTFWLMKYRVSGNQLETWTMNNDAAAQAVESGALRGIVEREGRRIKRVLISDSSENVATFLAQGGHTRLFPDDQKTVYQRVNP